MDLSILISFILGAIAGAVALSVISSSIRKAIENGVKAELAKLETYTATKVAVTASTIAAKA